MGNTLKETFASDDPCSNNDRNIGIAIGAIAGAFLGNQVKHSNTARLLGAAAGAALGGFIGHDMDRRRCELTKVAKANKLEVEIADIKVVDAKAPVGNRQESVGMSVSVVDRGNQFAHGSASPTPEAVKAFGEIARKYRAQAEGTDPNAVKIAQDRNRQMRILLVGHTDDTGSSRVNADLSEARARAVASIFADNGFRQEQVFYQGAGEVFPVADNRTEEGRVKNRRVEIVDLDSEEAFAKFLSARRPNIKNYRPAEPMTIASSPAPAKRNAQPKMSVAKGKPDASPATKTEASGQVRAALPTPAFQPETTGLAIDLGGTPANGQYRMVDIGKPVRNGVINVISSAYASDDLPPGSCAIDRPRISHGVKSLSTDRPRDRTSDYLPGTASASWGGKVNGHLVGLAHVGVLRNGTEPAGRPDVFIFKNYAPGSGAKPTLKTTADVNAYQGDKALLYRVFPEKGPIRCIDLLISAAAPSTAPNSNIIYNKHGVVYQTGYAPQIVR